VIRREIPAGIGPARNPLWHAARRFCRTGVAKPGEANIAARRWLGIESFLE
jgi:hypothetical protein